MPFLEGIFLAGQPSTPEPTPWYHDVTRYQWVVLALASAGWVFDIYEGQVFNVTRGLLRPDVLQVGRDPPDVRFYGDVLLGVFLVGGR